MIDNGKQVKHEGYTTDIITDLSLDWLKNRDKSKPFVLMSQHKAPHREWAPPLRHLGWDKDRVYRRAGDAVRRLCRPQQGGERPGHEASRRPSPTLDAKLDAPGSLTPRAEK